MAVKSHSEVQRFLVVCTVERLSSHIKKKKVIKKNNSLFCAPKRETPVRPLHRRFSSRKKILDHTPSSSLDLGTVLQPIMAKAIKVRSPREKDLSKCDRYVLTHQEVACDGEIRTQLIKVCNRVKIIFSLENILFPSVKLLKSQSKTNK